MRNIPITHVRIISISVITACILGAVILFIRPISLFAPTQPQATVSTQAKILHVIEVTQPLPNTKVTSPITILGRARGSWYFEASAPVRLKDATGAVIAHGTIKASTNWMTTDFVAFSATLAFTAPLTSAGTLVLTNDNPSGDPKKLQTLEIPVTF